ncbi:DUF4143 domain-containing protein [soil metagenome]
MDYLPRIVDSELDELLGHLPALAIEGAKAIGKTESARRRAGTVHRLDDPNQRQILGADPSRLTNGAAPILIDEWQRLPLSWDVVRRAVDDDQSAARFLLTGSAAPLEAPTHSGAGRIVTVRMRPLSLAERRPGMGTLSLGELLRGRRPELTGASRLTLTDYADEIVRSGFPAIRTFNGRALRAQLDGYLDRIVERDFAELGQRVRNPAMLRRWLAAFGAASSTTASFEVIRDASSAGDREKPARSTTQPYRAVLERLWMIDEVPAWLPSRNRLRRLATAPVRQLADPALVARLLGVDADALLEAAPAGPPMPRDGPLLGVLFEALVTLSVRVAAQASEARVSHLRTVSGDHEVDLIVERPDGRVVAIEVKLSQTVDDADLRHLRWLADRIGDDLLDAIVVTTGTEAYRRPDGIGVVPAALLMP